MESKLYDLKTRLLEINDLQAAAGLLSWDQTIYMPPGGAAARGRQFATLGRLAHERFIDPAIGQLLDALRRYEEQLPYDSDDAALIRVTRREYERDVRVPAEFVAQFASHQAASFDAWGRARPANDFASMRPFLEKTLELSRQYADFFPGYAKAFGDIGKERGWSKPTRAQFDAQLTPDGALLIGEPDAITEKILRHSEALGGISRITFMMNAATVPHAKLMRAIELLGTRVAPALREALPVAVA